MSEGKTSVADCVVLIADRLKAFQHILTLDHCITCDDYFMLSDIPSFSRETINQYLGELSAPDNFHLDHRQLSELQGLEKNHSLYLTFEELQNKQPHAPAWWRLFYENLWLFLMPHGSPISTDELTLGFTAVLEVLLVTLTKDVDFVNAARLMLLERHMTNTKQLGGSMKDSVAFAIMLKLFSRDVNYMRDRLPFSNEYFKVVYQLLVRRQKSKIPPQSMLQALFIVSRTIKKLEW